MAVRDKILGRVAALQPARGVAAAASRGYTPELPGGWGRLAALLGAETGVNKFGEHLVVRRWHDVPEAFAASLAVLRLIAPGAPETAVDL
jgi:hypothetical protein